MSCKKKRQSYDIIDQQDHQSCLVIQTEKRDREKCNGKECKRDTVLEVSRLLFHFMFPVLVSVSVSGDPLTKGRVQVRFVGVSFHFVFLPVFFSCPLVSSSCLSEDNKWSGEREAPCISNQIVAAYCTFISFTQDFHFHSRLK